MPHSDRRLSLDAPAKLNLFLHVTGRRDDGYHLLDSLVGFTEYGDRIFAQPDDALSLRVTGPFAVELERATDDNLILRAAKTLQRAFGTDAGAALTLEKNLPVASGIGGGSADAAAALRILAALWNIEADDDQMAGLGLSIGADVPVCFAGIPAHMSGIGEQISEVSPFPSCSVVLVNAGEAVSTPAVFAARKSGFSGAADWDTPIEFDAFIRALCDFRNDLAEPAQTVSPVIAQLLDGLRQSAGCALARLSGSGGTCFGLFEDAADAHRAAAELSDPRSGRWVVATTLRRSRPEITAA